MEKYLSRFRVETLASIAESYARLLKGDRPVWEFRFPDDGVHLVLFDLLRQEGEILVPDGLGVDVDGPGEDIASASERARNLAEGLVNLLSYASATACKPAVLISCHRIPNRLADVEAKWFHQDTHTPVGDPRPIDHGIFRSVYEHYDQSDDDAKWQISKATQWLRKGDLELETVGQFIAYWIGLEAVSQKLLTLLPPSDAEVHPACLKCELEVRFCPGCGESLGRPDRSGMAGVAELFARDIGGGKGTYARIRKHRGGLFHAGKNPTPGFMDSLREDLPVLRDALTTAIGMCLELADAQISRIGEAQLRRDVRPRRLTISGTLVAFEAPPLESPELQPFVEHKPEVEYSVAQEGMLRASFRHAITMRNASFQAEGYEVRGDENALAKD